jgi:hypothetical protein
MPLGMSPSTEDNSLLRALSIPLQPGLFMHCLCDTVRMNNWPSNDDDRHEPPPARGFIPPCILWPIANVASQSATIHSPPLWRCGKLGWGGALDWVGVRFMWMPPYPHLWYTCGLGTFPLWLSEAQMIKMRDLRCTCMNLSCQGKPYRGENIRQIRWETTLSSNALTVGKDSMKGNWLLSHWWANTYTCYCCPTSHFVAVGLWTDMRFMVPHKKSSPLTRLTESLIAMNGHSQSSKGMQVS